ncbi:MAG: Mur ligase domain-containing protein, partial [Hyphomicrobium sp.]
MRLREVVPDDATLRGDVAEREVTAITASSGDVQPGTIFAAMPGTKTDGALFIPDAIRRGASAI